MKNIFYIILLFTALSGFSACSSGDYNANPSSAASASINPLDPLDSAQFNWASSGTNPMSATINGSGWVADGVNYSFSAGQNVLYGYKGSTMVLELFLTNTWAGNIYPMGYKLYNPSMIWTDSIGNATSYYESELGNSGELLMLENDSVTIKGLFYFQGVNIYGNVINVTNGYFNVSKS